MMGKATSYDWYNIVGSDDQAHLFAGTRVERIRKPDGAIRYAAKYCSKKSQKVVPPGYKNVGRFWGCSRGIKPLPYCDFEVDQSTLTVLLDADEIPPYRYIWDASAGVVDRVPLQILHEIDDIRRFLGADIETKLVGGVPTPPTEQGVCRLCKTDRETWGYVSLMDAAQRICADCYNVI